MVACHRLLTVLALSFLLVGGVIHSTVAQSPNDPDPDARLFSRLIERAPVAPVVYGPDDREVVQDQAAIAFDELQGIWLDNLAIHADCAVESSSSPWDCGFAFRVTADGQHYRLWADSEGTWSLSLSSTGVIDTGTYEPIQTITVDLFVIGERGYLGINGAFVATLDLSANQEAGRVAIGTGFAARTATTNVSTLFGNLIVRSPGNPATFSTSTSPSSSTAATEFTELATDARANPPIFGPADGELAHDPARATFQLSGLALTDLFAHVECLPPVEMLDGLWDCGLILRVGPGSEQIRFVAVSDGFWAITQGPSEILASGERSRSGSAQSDPISLEIALIGDSGYASIGDEFLTDFRLTTALDSGDIGPGTAFYDMTYHENGRTRYLAFEVWPLQPDRATPAATPITAAPIAQSSASIDSPYISGREFTPPSGSIVFTWAEDWSIQKVQESGSRQTVTLVNGPLSATLLLYRSADAARTCTEFRIAEIDAISENGVTSTSIATDSSTENASLLTFRSAAAGPSSDMVAEIWCTTLPSGEVLALTQTAPAEIYLALIPNLLDPAIDLQMSQSDGEGAADPGADDMAAALDPETLTAQEAETFASFRLDPLDESGTGGYGLLERVRREIDVRALATGVEAGDVLVIRVGSCAQIDRATGDPLIVGPFDENGLVTGTIDIRLTLVVGQLPYVAVVYPDGDVSGANAIACGAIEAGFR